MSCMQMKNINDSPSPNQFETSKTFSFVCWNEYDWYTPLVKNSTLTQIQTIHINAKLSEFSEWLSAN